MAAEVTRRIRSRRAPAPGRLVTHDEAFRTLRANVLVATSDLPHPTVMVTSAVPGEGKTSTCAALAESIAASGPMVVAVDLDLRRPDLHTRFGVDNARGVSDVLSGRATVADCLVRVGLTGDAVADDTGDEDRGYPGRGALFVLPAGTPVSHPAELLGGPRTAQVLEALAEHADFVLIDTPPVLPVADALGVGRLVSGALLVVETGRVPLPAVQRAKAELARNQIRVLGMVLNRFEDQGTIAPYHYEYRATAAPAASTVGDLSRLLGRSRNGSRPG
ncbi:MAG TPA: CpsD/CapB family tyrosine-protein kinase [Iamia sp.]|nr:CpsD/CapB family tyrosine-protein kinase [Iamia sp.]